ncbi:hypothetical protein NKJ36_30060 [Mesorhizobium sp. M0142]|uniref:hypothetical protein n=1 Tax=Mesorhizobium sp. M0142 TaxID=2956894 RepID=UPI0033388428
MSLITITGLDRLSHGASIAPPPFRFIGRHLRPLAEPMALLAILELLAHAGAADPRFLPRLEEVAAAAWQSSAEVALAPIFWRAWNVT